MNNSEVKPFPLHDVANQFQAISPAKFKLPLLAATVRSRPARNIMGLQLLATLEGALEARFSKLPAETRHHP